MSRARKKSKKSGKPAAPRTAVQEALQVTWLLKGNLKSDSPLKLASLHNIGKFEAGVYNSFLA